MSPYRRNVMVGVVVLGALITLAWMLIQFGSAFVSPFAAKSVPVRFVADRADGISSGSAVTYRGVNVGRVDKVSRADDQLRVYIDAALDAQPPLPANIRAVIRSTGLVGSGAAIVLELTGTDPSGTLAANQSIDARFVGLDLIPTEVNDLVAELRATVKQFRESNLIIHVDQQVEKIGKVVDSVQTLIDDPKMREDLKAALASIRSTTEKADRLAANLETASGNFNKVAVDTQQAVASISKETSERLQQISKTLDEFQQIVEKLNRGQGTAGQLVNDPKLYENLVETARTLNATAKDLQRLVQQWEQEGVTLKLK